jgi:hypothetical protein
MFEGEDDFISRNAFFDQFFGDAVFRAVVLD